MEIRCEKCDQFTRHDAIDALLDQRKALTAETDALRAQLAAATERAEKAEAVGPRVEVGPNELMMCRNGHLHRLGLGCKACRELAVSTARTEKAEAERDALAARVAELEGALECIPVDLINAIENGEKVRIFLSTESCKLIGAALSHTPAQSLAKVQAAALREAADEIKQDDGVVGQCSAYMALTLMADRLEAEAANG